METSVLFLFTMKLGKKAYIVGNISEHNLPFRSTVIVDSIDEELNVVYCKKFSNGEPFIIMLEDLSNTRPPKPMRVFIFGDFGGDIVLSFVRRGHSVTHEFNTLDSDTNLELIAQHGAGADLVIANPAYKFDTSIKVDYNALHTEIFTAIFALKCKRIAFLSNTNRKHQALRPYNQVISVYRILGRVGKNTTKYLWLKGLPDLPLHQNYKRQTFIYEIAERMANTWTQFTLRSNTNF